MEYQWMDRAGLINSEKTFKYEDPGKDHYLWWQWFEICTNTYIALQKWWMVYC